jgi:GAF domain-containing protein
MRGGLRRLNGRIDDPFRNAPELLREGKWPAESDSTTDGALHRGDQLLRDAVALHSLLEFGDVAQQLLDLVMLRFPAQRTVLLWHEDDGSLRTIGRSQADGDCQGRAYEISQELLQQERSDSMLGGDSTSPPFFVCVPLRCRGKKVGTVYLEDEQRQAAFDASDVQSLDLLARHAGVALSNARVHERLQGDVRDLRVAIRMPRGLPGRLPEAPPAARLEAEVRPLSHLERDAILQALQEHRGNRTAAAHALRISVRKLQYKIKEYQQEGFDVPRSF